MGLPSVFPSVDEVVAGCAIFKAKTPIWLSHFGDDSWGFIDSSSPLYRGANTSSILWSDYINGRGATLKHPNSFSNAKYEYCLTPEIVSDLKIAAAIFACYPKLIKDARSSKAQVDPKTVKGRIDDLAKIFSLAISIARDRSGIVISRLDQITFPLLKEAVVKYSGRGAHLKRALKLISDEMVQRNLSAALQWGLLDITKSSIVWPASIDNGGIETLPDTHFLFLLSFCKRAIARFKWTLGLEIHDSDCRNLTFENESVEHLKLQMAINGYYKVKATGRINSRFRKVYGVDASEVADLIRNAHSSALLIVLLLTGMRDSEVAYLYTDCLCYQHGYWFLKSKVVKGQPKDVPVAEGWLAIDLTRDAYDILSFFCRLTGSNYLFSSPFPGFVKDQRGYSTGGTLNTKFARWFKTIDVDGVLGGWKFSVHQCRETLVSQLAKQEVGLPFISMQLKHFHSQFNRMPNAVTVGYGQYRSQLITSISNRIVEARETALLDVYGESATFAGGGGPAHKARIDAFFSGLGLFGEQRELYIKAMARRGVKLMPTSIGNCTKNFIAPSAEGAPPCYGDYQCDPDCPSHVITERCANALLARRSHAQGEASKESDPSYKAVWFGLVEKLDAHINKFDQRRMRVR